MASLWGLSLWFRFRWGGCWWHFNSAQTWRSCCLSIFSVGGESGITLDLFWFHRELSCCSGKSSKTFLMVLREQELSSLKCCQEGSWRIITKHKHCHPALEFISQLLYFNLLCKQKNIKDFDIIDIMLLVLDQGERFQLMKKHPHILRRISSFFVEANAAWRLLCGDGGPKVRGAEGLSGSQMVFTSEKSLWKLITDTAALIASQGVWLKAHTGDPGRLLTLLLENITWLFKWEGNKQMSGGGGLCKGLEGWPSCRKFGQRRLHHQHMDGFTQI